MRVTNAVPVVVLLAFLAAPSVLAKKKPKDEPAPPPAPTQGWVMLGSGTPCYNPPAWGGMTEMDRRRARQNTYQELFKLVTGGKIPEISFDEEQSTQFEVAFLGRPEKIEGMSRENWDKCQDFAAGRMSLSDYRYWLQQTAKEAMKGECQNPLMYELHDYLDIQKEWQVRRHICKGDRVLLESTETAKYAVAEAADRKKTRWITLMGDPDVPRAGEGYPCPDCALGALVVRFEDEETSETTVQAVGASLEFTAPGNGHISFAINDTTWFDNRFFEQQGLKDYLAIDIFPPVKEGAGAAN